MQITFHTHAGRQVTVSCQQGETLLSAAQRAGVTPEAPCAGAGTCGKCTVRLLNGQTDGDRAAVSASQYDAGYRLACRTYPVTDCHVFVPAVRDFAVETEDLTAEQKKRAEDCRKKWHTKGQGLGFAVDIGTTSVCALLVDLESGAVLCKGATGNRQAVFGADVLNRIVAQSKPGGIKRLQDAVTEQTLVPLMEKMLLRAGADKQDVRLVTVAANPTMNHLLVGTPADCLRRDTLGFRTCDSVTAGQFGLPAFPDAPVRIVPNVGAFVGGDIVAGILSSDFQNSDDTRLFADLGTNGELVLGNREFLITCACSAGPAFEGGDIRCGMRYMPGAVDACRVQNDELTFSVAENAPMAGICGTGLIDTVSALLETGRINGRGKFIRQEPAVTRDSANIGAFALSDTVFLTETDIDNYIRAKGAVRAAIDTLVSAVGVPLPEDICISGGIGNRLNTSSAVQTGLFPAAARFSFLGNTSLLGAYAVALSPEAYRVSCEIADGMTYLDLSSVPGYMDAFTARCFLRA